MKQIKKMKQYLFILIISLVCLFPKQDVLANTPPLPDNAPSADFFIELLWRPFSTYIFQVTRKSIIKYPSDHCRIFHFTPTNAHPDSSTVAATDATTNVDNKIFSFCIERLIGNNSITEILKFQANHRDAGQITIRREGENLKPTKNSKLFNFQLPLSHGTHRYYLTTHPFNITMTIINEKFSSSATTKIISDNNDILTLAITEMYKNGVSQREYILTSLNANMVIPSLSVRTIYKTKDMAETRYYMSNKLDHPITPKDFNTLLNSLFFSPSRGVSMTLLMNNQINLDWPFL